MLFIITVLWDGPNFMSSMKVIWKLLVTCWILGLMLLLWEEPICPQNVYLGKLFWPCSPNVFMVARLIMNLIRDFFPLSWKSCSIQNASKPIIPWFKVIIAKVQFNWKARGYWPKSHMYWSVYIFVVFSCGVRLFFFR